MPAKLLEINYISNSNEKKTILDDFLRRLEALKETKISYSNAQSSALIKILKDCIEESNMLLVTVAVQIIIRLVSLMKGCFNEIVTKQMIIETASKVRLSDSQFQAPTSKNTINELILTFFSAAVKSEAISLNSFIDLVLEQIQSNKKMNTRECFLCWLELKLHEVESKSTRMSLRDSIDWSYDQGSKDPTVQSNRNAKCGVDYIEGKLNEILAKEQNTRIKAIIKSHIKRFDEMQVRGNRPIEAQKGISSNQNSKKVLKKPVIEPRKPKEEAFDEEPVKMNEKPSFTKPGFSDETEKKSLLNYSIVNLDNQRTLQTVSALSPQSVSLI